VCTINTGTFNPDLLIVTIILTATVTVTVKSNPDTLLKAVSSPELEMPHSILYQLHAVERLDVSAIVGDSVSLTDPGIHMDIEPLEALTVGKGAVVHQIWEGKRLKYWGNNRGASDTTPSVLKHQSEFSSTSIPPDVLAYLSGDTPDRIKKRSELGRHSRGVYNVTLGVNQAYNRPHQGKPVSLDVIMDFTAGTTNNARTSKTSGDYQMASLRELFVPFLKPGGIFIVDDIEG